jgi:hypothetical protein
MEERAKIVFGQPEYLPSPVHGVEVVYSYKLLNAQIENLKSEKSRYFKIEVLIDHYLANDLGFQFWGSPDTYSGLIKLLLPDVIDEIKRKYYCGTLSEFEKFNLLTSNHAIKGVNDFDKLPEVEGFEEII